MTRKKAIVTGASEGLGRTFIKALEKQGYDTTSIARNENRLQELMKELAVGEHDYLVADLSSTQGLEDCLKKIEEENYDLLINNAGYSRFGEFDQASIEEEQKIMQVNCQAPMALSHAFLKKAKQGDALINLSSITHYMPTPIQPTYCATKSFMASFSQSLWYQQRKHGVYVQGLCPGVTKTQFIERAGEVDKKFLLDLISQSPEQVINTSLKALDKRKGPIIIPGVANQFIAILFSVLPKRLTTWLVGKLGEFA